MSDIRVPRYEANEIAKQEDFDFGNDIEYVNLSIIFNELFGKSTNDIIIDGLSCQQRGTPSMNVDLTKGLSYCISTSKLAHSGSLFGPISITNGGAQDRIDTLEIRLLETDYDQQQRAFKDPVTGDITYQDVYTKTRFEIEAQIINGTEGAGVAPNHTAGWIKIAEIHVDLGETTSILNTDIENCTGGYDTEVTANWTAETAITFRTGSISEFKTLFRTSHDEDGDHTDNIIKTEHIDWGLGGSQVKAINLPIADAGGRIAATEVEAALQEIAGSGRTTETLKSALQRSILTTQGDLLIQGASVGERLAGGLLDTVLKGQGAGVKPIFEKFALRDTGVHIGNGGTRSTDGDQVITGVGFQPSVIIFFAGDTTESFINFSIGFDDGTVHMALNIFGDVASQRINTVQSIDIDNGGGNRIKGEVSALGADGFTITWNLMGTRSVNFIYLCLP